MGSLEIRTPNAYQWYQLWDSELNLHIDFIVDWTRTIFSVQQSCTLECLHFFNNSIRLHSPHSKEMSVFESLNKG